MVRVFVRAMRFRSGGRYGAGTTLTIVARTHEFPAREHELDHEEGASDARAATKKHDGS
jgi:hypothetical protein